MGKSVSLVEGSISVIVQAVLGLVIVFVANYFGEVTPPYAYSLVIGAFVGIQILQLIIQSSVGAAPANLIGWGLIILLVSMDTMNPGMLRATPNTESPPLVKQPMQHANVSANASAPGGQASVQKGKDAWKAMVPTAKINMLQSAKTSVTFALGDHVAKGLMTGDKSVSPASVTAILPMVMKEMDPLIQGYRLGMADSDAGVKAAAQDLFKTTLGPNTTTLIRTMRVLSLLPQSKGGSRDSIGTHCEAEQSIMSCELTGDRLDEVIVTLADESGKAALLKRKTDLEAVRVKALRFVHQGKSEVLSLSSLPDNDVSDW